LYAVASGEFSLCGRYSHCPVVVCVVSVVRRVTGGVPLSLYTGPNAKANWANLGARLAVWRENIHGVLQTLSAQAHQQVQQEEGEELQ
jgi:hypothetical protein